MNKYSLTRQETASLLRIDASSVSRLLPKLKYGVHYVRIGRRVLFNPEALIAWLEVIPAKRK
jgi:hypothetical protein